MSSVEMNSCVKPHYKGACECSQGDTHWNPISEILFIICTG